MYSGEGSFRELGVYQLLAAFKRFSASVLPRMAALGLAPGQEQLLFELWCEEGLSQRELVERLGVEQPTVAKTVRRLEDAGFVRRVKDDRDARVSRVLLTDRGRQVREPVLKLWSELDEEFGSRLSPGERAQLVSLLRRSFAKD